MNVGRKPNHEYDNFTILPASEQLRISMNVTVSGKIGDRPLNETAHISDAQAVLWAEDVVQ